MDILKADLFIKTHGHFFQQANHPFIRMELEKSEDFRYNELHRMTFNSPGIIFFISLFFGWLGIDRFLNNQRLLGFFKLITIGGLGMWYLVDLFLIMDAVKKSNFEKLLTCLGI